MQDVCMKLDFYDGYGCRFGLVSPGASCNNMEIKLKNRRGDFRKLVETWRSAMNSDPTS